jgi:hypothetical protein
LKYSFLSEMASYEYDVESSSNNIAEREPGRKHSGSVYMQIRLLLLK